MNDMEDPAKKAQEHWDWVGGLFATLPGVEINLDTLEYLYITSFEHGYKHGEEAKE